MKSIAGVVILAILIGLNGCIAWPVSKRDVIGIYQSVLEDGTPGLPDGGSEVLELKPDGTCKQEITLKDGRNFDAQGTWEWRPGKSYINPRITLWGLYCVVDIEQEIDPDFEKTLGKVSQALPASRTLSSRIILGSDEGVHYEKK